MKVFNYYITRNNPDKLRSKICNLTVDNINLKSEIEKIKKARKIDETEFKNTILEFKETIKNKDIAYDNLLTDYNLREELINLKEDNQKLRNEIISLKKELKHKEDLYKVALDDLDTLQKEVESKNNEIGNLKDQLNWWKQQCDDLEMQIGDINE